MAKTNLPLPDHITEMVTKKYSGTLPIETFCFLVDKDIYTRQEQCKSRNLLLHSGCTLDINKLPKHKQRNGTFWRLCLDKNDNCLYEERWEYEPEYEWVDRIAKHMTMVANRIVQHSK